MAISKALSNTLSSFAFPLVNVDNVTFTVYSGADIASAQAGENVKPKNKVILRVNPQEVGYNKEKIVQKVQTNAANRFIVFDWGTDLTSMTITGSTGNLLPESVLAASGFMSKAVDAIGDSISADMQGVKNVDKFIQDRIVGSMPYADLIEMSPKFKAFLELNDLYENFDADQDILVLELGKKSYRGFFMNFSFTHSAESPWNWKYSITFLSLIELTKFYSRGDPQIPTSKSNIVSGE